MEADFPANSGNDTNEPNSVQFSTRLFFQSVDRGQKRQCEPLLARSFDELKQVPQAKKRVGDEHFSKDFQFKLADAAIEILLKLADGDYHAFDELTSNDIKQPFKVKGRLKPLITHGICLLSENAKSVKLSNHFKFLVSDILCLRSYKLEVIAIVRSHGVTAVKTKRDGIELRILSELASESYTVKKLSWRIGEKIEDVEKAVSTLCVKRCVKPGAKLISLLDNGRIQLDKYQACDNSHLQSHNYPSQSGDHGCDVAEPSANALIPSQSGDNISANALIAADSQQEGYAGYPSSLYCDAAVSSESPANLHPGPSDNLNGDIATIGKVSSEEEVSEGGPSVSSSSSDHLSLNRRVTIHEGSDYNLKEQVTRKQSSISHNTSRTTRNLSLDERLARKNEAFINIVASFFKIKDECEKLRDMVLQKTGQHLPILEEDPDSQISSLHISSYDSEKCKRLEMKQLKRKMTCYICVINSLKQSMSDLREMLLEEGRKQGRVPLEDLRAELSHRFNCS